VLAAGLHVDADLFTHMGRALLEGRRNDGEMIEDERGRHRDSSGGSALISLPLKGLSNAHISER
jgi:hypothetical protein